jgi:hypothetical protein
LTPGQDLGVIQVGLVVATTAVEFDHGGLAAFGPAVGQSDWRAPQDRPQLVAGPASGKDRGGVTA